MKNKGFFISIEGIDGSGKSTQADLLYDFLQTKYDVIKTREPGGCEISEKIRDILLSRDLKLFDTTELLLMEAARSEHFFSLIKPSLDTGKIVICERFIDSTIAYQGYGRGMDLVKIESFNDFATNGIKPDITLFFDTDENESYGRIEGAFDRLEKEGIDFQKKVRQGFLKIAERESDRVRVINVFSLAKEEVHEKVVSIISSVLGKRL
ncbi:dTMP kinase [bacterium]